MTESSFKSFHSPLVAEKIVFLDEIGSTNEYAKELGRGGAHPGICVIAAKQTAGRGRLGRSWDGGEASDIYMSALLKPKNDPSHLTLMAGICVRNVLSALLASTPHNPLIKWPNDIIVDGKKICGILVEGGIFGTVVGIGINVMRESFSSELAGKATSLNMLTGIYHDRVEIIKALLAELSRYYEKFEEHGISSFIDEYRSLCVNIGKAVIIHEQAAAYNATAIGIDEYGRLEVILEDGQRRALDSGEVSVRGIYGKH